MENNKFNGGFKMETKIVLSPIEDNSEFIGEVFISEPGKPGISYNLADIQIKPYQLLQQISNLLEKLTEYPLKKWNK